MMHQFLGKNYKTHMLVSFTNLCHVIDRQTHDAAIYFGF